MGFSFLGRKCQFILSVIVGTHPVNFYWSLRTIPSFKTPSYLVPDFDLLDFRQIFQEACFPEISRILIFLPVISIHYDHERDTLTIFTESVSFVYDNGYLGYRPGRRSTQKCLRNEDWEIS